MKKSNGPNQGLMGPCPLEELNLYLSICDQQTFIDGTNLKKNILNSMSQLRKFQFSISSIIYLNNEINLPSNNDIQNTFKDFQDNQIISSLDYFFESRNVQCHIFSYPYKRRKYERISNNFPCKSFPYVREISLFDRQPFGHEFFLRITQAFPNLKILKLENEQAQKKNHHDSSITRYLHLTELHLVKAHDDYIEEFLIHSKTYLPYGVNLTVRYAVLQRITEHFTRTTIQINYSKLIRLNLFLRDRHFNFDDIKRYFPHAKISSDS